MKRSIRNIFSGRVHTGAIIAILLIGALTTCSSQQTYRAADRGGFGYTERQITEDQYRINFKARGDDTGRAMDYAMLRASELTMQKGFDWFDIASRDTLVNRERVTPAVHTGFGVGYQTVRDCGVLTCRTYQRPTQQYQSSMHLGDSRSEVEVIMEIRMGKGMRPSNDQSYDAREVYQHLKPDAS
jgi:hypothetical protein